MGVIVHGDHERSESARVREVRTDPICLSPRTSGEDQVLPSTLVFEHAAKARSNHLRDRYLFNALRRWCWIYTLLVLDLYVGGVGFIHCGSMFATFLRRETTAQRSRSSAARSRITKQ